MRLDLRRSVLLGAAGAALVTSLLTPTAARAADPLTPPGAGDSGSAAVSPMLDALAASGEAPSTDGAKEDAGMAVRGAGSPLVDAAERVAVSVRFSSFATRDAAVAAAGALGPIRSVTRSAPTIVLSVPTSSFDAVGALPGALSVSPALTGSTSGSPAAVTGAIARAATPGCRTIPVNADPALHSDLARADFGVDGTGVSVGIISNSFHDYDGTPPASYTSPAQDVAAGSLPGAGNPCGYLTDVTVLKDDVPGDDEGRAMAQVVHGVAPGARLLFSSGGVSDAEYADSILDLVAHGAKIIVDDFIFPAEPWFQQGLIARTIQDVRAQGVLYIAAAQNQNSIATAGADVGKSVGSFEADAYSGVPCPTEVVTAIAPAATVSLDCQDFGTHSIAGNDRAVLEAQLDYQGTGGVMVQWGDPVYAVDDVVLPVVQATAPGTNNWTTVAVGGLQSSDLPFSLAPLSSLADGVWDIRISLARLWQTGTTPQTPRVKMVLAFDDDGVQELDRTDWPAGTTIGPSIVAHPEDPAVFTIGAVNAQTPSTMAAYSSTGPVRYLFAPVRDDGQPSAALTDQTPRPKPDVTSVDGVQTTFFSPPATNGQFIFYGTSAAAPDAAAVAALAMQYSPQSTAQQVRDALVTTAVPLPAQPYDWRVGTPDVSGSGLIDAVAVLRALPAAVSPAEVGTATRLPDTGEPFPGVALGVAVLLVGVGVGMRRRACARRVSPGIPDEV